MNGPGSKAGFHNTGSEKSGAKSPGSSIVVVTAAALCAGAILVWLSWSFIGQVARDLSAADMAGQSSVEQSGSRAALGRGAGADGPPLRTGRSQGAGADGADGASAATDAQALVVETQPVSRADSQEGGVNSPDNTMPSDAPFGEVLDDEPVLLPISGWVLDQDGAPVADIEVSASARRLAQGDDTGGFARRANSTHSDESGYFAFDDLPDGEYLLATEAIDDFDGARTTVRAGVSSAVLRVLADSGRRVTIHGSVTDDRGHPIAGVRVAPTDEGRATTRSDSAGAYKLQLTAVGRSRTRSIRFAKRGYRARTLAVRESQLDGVSEVRLDAQLAAAGEGVSVRGIVMGEDQRAITGARVRLYAARLRSSHVAVTGGDGSFVMEDVEPGHVYQLSVRPAAAYQDHFEDGLVIGGDGLDLAILLDALGVGNLRGRMVDTYGAPVPRYTLWMRSSAPGARGDFAVTSRSDGSFQVGGIPAGEVSFGSRGEPLFSMGGFHLEPGRTTTAQLIVDWGREELAGTVVDTGGDPVAGAEITLLWSVYEQGITSRSRRRTVTDASGYFVFTELGPGPRTLSVSAKGYRSVRREETSTMPGGELLIQLQESTS